MISFFCQACGRSYQVQDTYAGRRVKCSHCGNAIHVPSSPSSEAGAAPPQVDTPPSQADVSSAVGERDRGRDDTSGPVERLPWEALLISVIGIIGGLAVLISCPYFAMLLVADAYGTLGHPDVPLIHLIKEHRPYYYATAISTLVMMVLGSGWVCAGIGLIKKRSWAWHLAVYLLAIGIPLHITYLSYNYIVHYVTVPTCANGYTWLQHHRWYVAAIFGLRPVGCILSIGLLLLLLRKRVHAFFSKGTNAGAEKGIGQTVLLGGGNAIALRILMILAWIVAVFFLAMALIAPSIQRSNREYIERRYSELREEQ